MKISIIDTPGHFDTRINKPSIKTNDELIDKSNLKLREDPFSATVQTRRLSTTCSFCFKLVDHLSRCGKCKFLYYCDDRCQKNDWSHHKRECQRLRRFHSLIDDKFLVRKFPQNLIDEDREELASQFPDETLRLVARLTDVWNRQETKSYESGGRTLDMLETNAENILKDSNAKSQFDLFCGLYEFYCTGDGSNGRPEYDKRKLLQMYGLCRSNAFCIKDDMMKSIGCGIYLNLRRLKHSCKPNARIVFNGRQAVVVVLIDFKQDGTFDEPILDSYDRLQSRYVDCLSPRNERRRLLKETYFFDCRCHCCQSDRSRNDAMEGLRCDNIDGCDGVAVLQSIDDDDSGEYKCRKCHKKYDDQENPKLILKLTKEILDSSASKRRAITEPSWAKDVYANLACMQMPTLHPDNIYFLRTMKESYETACRLGNWADAASYGKQTLEGYRKYMNEYSDPEYAFMALNVAKANINHYVSSKVDQRCLQFAYDNLKNCERCFLWAFGYRSPQCQLVTNLRQNIVGTVDL